MNSDSVIRSRPSLLRARPHNVSMRRSNSLNLQSWAVCTLDGRGDDEVGVDSLSDRDEGECSLACLGLKVAPRSASSTCSRLRGGVSHLCSPCFAPSATRVWGGIERSISSGGIIGDAANIVDYWIAQMATAITYTCWDSCWRWSSWFLYWEVLTRGFKAMLLVGRLTCREKAPQNSDLTCLWMA